jgi:hypothetical protein
MMNGMEPAKRGDSGITNEKPIKSVLDTKITGVKRAFKSIFILPDIKRKKPCY